MIQDVAMDNLMRLAMQKQPIDVGQWLINRAGLNITPSKAEYSKITPINHKLKPIQVPSSLPSDAIDNFQELNYG
ncbi:MAG: hypothetical protein RIQ94_3020 [Pseudomonadota bacterium]|jgi:hypothetical protein